ncbi:MAG: hypothetical protein ACFE9S_10510 [Candidatus Hermodarchaeota archaeon]
MNATALELFFGFIIFILLINVWIECGNLLIKKLAKINSEEKIFFFVNKIMLGIAIYTIVLFILSFLTEFFVNPKNYFVGSNLTIFIIQLNRIRKRNFKFNEKLKSFSENIKISFNDFFSGKEHILMRTFFILILTAIFLILISRSIFIPISGNDAIGWIDYKGFTITFTNSYDYITPRIEHPLMLPLIHSTVYSFIDNDTFIQLFYVLAYFLIIIFIKNSLDKEIPIKKREYSYIGTLLVATSPVLLNWTARSYADPVVALFFTVSVITSIKALKSFSNGNYDKYIAYHKISFCVSIFLPWIKSEGVGLFIIFHLLFLMNALFVYRMKEKSLIIRNHLKYLVLTCPVVSVWPLISSVFLGVQSEYTTIIKELILEREILSPRWEDLLLIIKSIFIMEFGILIKTSGLIIPGYNIPYYNSYTSLFFYLIWGATILGFLRILMGKANEKENLIGKILITTNITSVCLFIFAFYISPYRDRLGWAIGTFMDRLILIFLPILIFFTVIYISTFSTNNEKHDSNLLEFN